ncbi:MAG: glutaredoxin family protein, partial [Alphaproteobacteria bacterium]
MLLRSIILGIFLFLSQGVSALTLDVFYSPTCPHCHSAMKFIDSNLKKEFPNLDVKKHNVFVSTEAEFMRSEVRRLSLRSTGVPLIVIGDDYFSGFGSAKTTGEELRKLVQSHISGKVKKKNKIDPVEKRYVKAGWFGEVDLLETSLPALAIVLGLVDGFNPCAMWVLVFMIGLIIEIKDRKKIWTIVGT